MQIMYCHSCGVKLSPNHGATSDLCESCTGKIPHTVPTKPPSRKSSATRLPALKAQAPATGRQARRSPIDGNRVPQAAVGSEHATSPAQNIIGPGAKGGTGFYFCEKCGKRVTDADIAAGRARNKQVKGIYCEMCAEGALTVSFDAITMPEMLKEKSDRKTDRRAASSRIVAVKQPVPEPAQHRQRSNPPKGNSMLTIGIVGVVVVIAGGALVLRLDSADETKSKTNAAVKKLAVTIPPAVTENRVETRPASPIQSTNPPVAEPKTRDIEKAPEAFDPREIRAQSLLDQAHKAFAASPKDLSIYRDRLKAIVDGYASTAAGKEAANDLKSVEAAVPPNGQNETAIAPPGAEPPTKTISIAQKPPAYALWLKDFLGHWAKRDWTAARQAVASAFKNTDFGSQTDLLKADLECVVLAEAAEQAAAKGAAVLMDGRPFTLESVKKKDRFEIGKTVKVVKTDGNAITVEQIIAGGKITFNIPFADLTRETTFNLSRIGLPDDAKGKLALTLLRFADYLRSGTEKSDSKFEELLEQARSTRDQSELLNRLLAWLGQIDIEKRAAIALAAVERLIASGKAGEASEALSKFMADFAQSAFIVDQAAMILEYAKRIEYLRLEPGLLAKYFSGDIDNHRKVFHLSRTISMLEHDFGSRSPAPGVPSDKYDIEITGILRIKDAGEYTFAYIGDDFLEVWVDDKSLGKSQWDRPLSVKVQFTAGDHKFKAVHSNNVANASFKIKWRRPGQTHDEPLPTNILFHAPDETSAQKPK